MNANNNNDDHDTTTSNDDNNNDNDNNKQITTDKAILFKYLFRIIWRVLFHFFSVNVH